MAIRITYNGYTLINIQDGVFGTNIIGNSTNTSTYNFLTGFIGSYLEGVVLNLAGDKNAGSAAIYFMEDYYNNKTLNFTYDNKTGTLQIHTENNTDYMITLCSNGDYTYMIMNSRNSSKNLKTTTAETNIIITKEICGGYGSIGYGYNYENAAISIFMSCLPGSGEVKIARIAEKALHKQVTIATRTVLCNKGLTTYSSYLHEYAKTFETGVGCSAFVECCRYHPND